MTKEERLKIAKDRLVSMAEFDKSIGKNQMVLGIDEAGRGPLAGPVVVCACSIDFNDDLVGIDDSKKISEKNRERLFEVIMKNANHCVVEIANNNLIDKVNILNATKIAMKLAYTKVGYEFEHIITDYVKIKFGDSKVYPITKADSKSLSTACASVVAKVTRDRIMKEYALTYSEYGFERHKGYGTKLHYEMIYKYGVSEIHRKTFLKKFLER